MTSPLVLVLDAMGVIYDHGDDVDELLVPYVRSLGCTMSQSQINAYYIQCSLGRTTSKQLWEELGVADRANDVDYISHHRLTPGVLDVLMYAWSNGWVVACLSNDVAEWPIYEQLMASVGVSGESIIFVDDREKNLRGPHAARWQCFAYGHTRSEEFRDIPRVASIPELEAILKGFSL